MGKSIHQVVEEPLQDIPLVEVDPVVVGDHDPVVTINMDDTHQDQGGESNANTNHGERQTSAKVHISAPSNLSAGYQLPVLVNGEPRLVRVPPGGVVQGQTFEGEVFDERSTNPHRIPRKHWRDHLCDCFSLGCCHPLVCLSFWFTPVALGQLLTRTKLDACGNPLSNKGSFRTTPFKLMLWSMIAYATTDVVLATTTSRYHKHGFGWYDLNTGGNVSSPSSVWGWEDGTPAWAKGVEGVRHILGIAYSVWILVVMVRVRQHVMRRSEIKPKCCPSACNGGLESCCVSVFCGCCSVSQMARHTGDYDTYKAACCTENGLSAAPDSYDDEV